MAYVVVNWRKGETHREIHRRDCSQLPDMRNQKRVHADTYAKAVIQAMAVVKEHGDAYSACYYCKPDEMLDVNQITHWKLKKSHAN